ncbi:MAG: hypothetical protein K0U98_02925 [Deltaproteobacteria bacterium]|nr:hypothetical protein [Deltaproteobacteria bacterium]
MNTSQKGPGLQPWVTSMKRYVIAGLILIPVAGTASAGPPPITPLVVEGDTVAGVGNVTSISTFAINNSGDWLVEADTDNANTDIDNVLLENGSLAFQEGDSLNGPAGITLGSFDSITLNNSGQSGFNFFLDGAMTGEDSSVHAYLDTATSLPVGTVLVLQEGGDFPDLSPMTPLIGIFDVKINDPGQLLVTASVDDPAIPSTVDRALTLWTSDETLGGIVTSELIAAEGDILTGQATALTDFGTGPHETAINGSGDVLFAVDIPGADAIYLWDGAFTEIAQEGDPSPIAGRNWATLTSSTLDLNAAGDHVYRGSLDGDSTTNSVIIHNGAKLIQEGDSLPAIGGTFLFTSFGSGPVEISDSGDVLWFGDWDDPDTTVDSGLFLNDVLIVQEGVTEVTGLGIIDTVRGIVDGYHMSDDGLNIVFEAVLDSGDEGAFLLQLTSNTIFADGFESGDTSAWSLTFP